MMLARVVLLGAALAYGGLGLAFLFWPTPMAEHVELFLGSATADNDVRAVYGGLSLGLAVFLLLSLRRLEWFRPALWVVALTLAAMASARIVSLVVAGTPHPIAFALHSAEVVGFVLALLALRRLPARHETL